MALGSPVLWNNRKRPGTSVVIGIRRFIFWSWWTLLKSRVLYYLLDNFCKNFIWSWSHEAGNVVELVANTIPVPQRGFSLLIVSNTDWYFDDHYTTQQNEIWCKEHEWKYWLLSACTFNETDYESDLEYADITLKNFNLHFIWNFYFQQT